MRVGTVWTPALDGTLLRLRAAGAGWGEIALALALGRYTVVERGRRLGARKMPAAPVLPVIEDRDRPPRGAGHPDSWGLITAGTVLEGLAYPYPVFL
jgi:hypothetical protein